MRNFVIIVAALICQSASAQADIIEADFAGTAQGAYYVPVPGQLIPFNHAPFTAQFFFDTAASTIHRG